MNAKSRPRPITGEIVPARPMHSPVAPRQPIQTPAAVYARQLIATGQPVTPPTVGQLHLHRHLHVHLGERIAVAVLAAVSLIALVTVAFMLGAAGVGIALLRTVLSVVGVLAGLTAAGMLITRSTRRRHVCRRPGCGHR